MEQNATLEELMRLRAHIAALEAELALYAFRYGLTHEARRLLAKRLQDSGATTKDS